MAGKDGLNMVAGGGESEEELMRGEGGYNGGSVAGEAGGEATGSGGIRRGVGGYNGEAETTGGVSGTGGEVRELIKALEQRIKDLEEKAKATKQSEGNRFELVNIKNMTPNVLKDGTAFRNWREDFERWAGLKVKGLQDILKLVGGSKHWGEAMQEQVDRRLKVLGYLESKEEIEEQLKVALEAYTVPSSEERNIVMAQKGGMRAYLELCKHHDLRTDATANKLRGEIMDLGKPSKTRKEVKESIINLEAKRTRLAEMVKNKSGELQPEWLKTILM